MIERSEGCKFMECAKCKYQFCWLCLSEFYTQYHYYESLCPLRSIALYAFVVVAALLFNIKVIYTYPMILQLQGYLLFYGVVI